MKKILLIIISGISTCAFSQDINFSHLNHSRLFINPGFAGSEKISNLTVSHRNFSPANFGNYVTYKVSYNQFFDFINGGLGLQIIRDNQGSGAINRTYISGLYSYRIRLQRNLILLPALESKYAMYSLQTKDLVFPDMFDKSAWTIGTSPASSPELFHQSANYLEFNTGAILIYTNEYLRRYRDLTIGLAVHHLNKPTSLMDQENKIKRKLSVYFDIELFLNRMDSYQSSTLLIPTFFFSQQGSANIFQYGSYLKYKNFMLGGFIRHNSAFRFITPIFQVGMSYDDFKISYSYDAGFLDYKKISVFSGAHEVTLSLNFSIKGVNKQ
ncbi:MAG: PorP/SprF family type IX secretion system membrane protein [Bacteroidales bacterium]